MHAPLYAKVGSTALKNSPLSAHPADTASSSKLLPEHALIIYRALYRKLALANLTSQQFRVMSTIFTQTVGFDKREDDMNGARLEQLTKIRSDHANETVRQLERMNLIVTRQGRYGKWLAINFDLAHWGEDYRGISSTDPRGLLPQDYHTTPIDAGDCFLSSGKTADVLPPESGDTMNTLHQTPTTTAPLAQPDQPTPTPKPRFDYPEHLPPRYHAAVAQHLDEMPDVSQAQGLLQYFAQCLQKHTINNPFAYFIALKNRVLNGTLTLAQGKRADADVNAEKPATSSLTPSAAVEHAYREAVLDYQQMKRHISQQAQQEQRSFADYLHLHQLSDWWETLVQGMRAAQAACFKLNTPASPDI